MGRGETAILQKIAAYTREKNLVFSGARVLCALSGGCDSVALTLALWNLRRQLGIEVFAAHVNHRLRGQESERDADFCGELCARKGIPFFLLEGDAAGEARMLGKGLEAGARKLRYALLERLAGEKDFDLIATAHTADDNLETVLMNLVRGSGSAGLAGIPPKRGIIVRPALCLSRGETEGLLEAYGEAHVEDSTNESRAYRRNTVRMELVPLLKAMNPALAGTVLRQGEALRSDGELLDRLAEENAVQNNKIDVAALLALPEAVALRAVRDEAARFGVEADFNACISVLRLAAAESPSGVLPLGGGLLCTREYGGLFFGRSEETPPLSRIPLKEGGNRLNFKNMEVCIKKAAAGTEIEKNVFKLFNILYINCDIINGELIARARMRGDMFRRNSGSGEKPLSRLMSDLKIPRRRRDELLLIADGDRVLWAEGIGANASVPQADGGKDYFIIEIRYVPETAE